MEIFAFWGDNEGLFKEVSLLKLTSKVKYHCGVTVENCPNITKIYTFKCGMQVYPSEKQDT